MHKNMYYKNLIIDIFAVTFRKEGVDWNWKMRSWKLKASCHLPQGRCGLKYLDPWRRRSRHASPSARKVWIEMERSVEWGQATAVTFRKEGVDWNLCVCHAETPLFCHLPQGRCGLKYKVWLQHLVNSLSPSARKVWIEIATHPKSENAVKVTFRKEGVDWN